MGEVPDPLRVSPSPCRHARLLNSFRAVDAVLLALHGDERPPAAGALARSELTRSKPWREFRYGQRVSAVGRVFARHNPLVPRPKILFEPQRSMTARS